MEKTMETTSQDFTTEIKWSELTWNSIEQRYQSILKMPFIQELINGTLPIEKFQFYLMQDSLYLEHFSRTLAMIGARSNTMTEKQSFIGFADTTIMIENALHEHYFKIFDVNEKAAMEPACHHYVHFLKSSAAWENVEVAMASVLPCYWIYKKVGQHIYKNQKSINNPYQKWIDTYSGGDYSSETQQAIDICDLVAKNANKDMRNKMTAAFQMGTNMEFSFWDGAYNLKRWGN